MLIQIIASIFLITAIILVKKCVIQPKEKILKYRKLFQSKGYKVYVFPYKPFSYPIIQTIYKDSAKGDALFSYKNEFSHYDVLIGNQLNRPSISLLNPKLRIQFAKAQRQQNYQKLKSFKIQQARFAGYGLIFSEGKDWKRKRMIMGSLFTFDLIKRNVHQIQIICKKALEKFQQKNFEKNSKKQFDFLLNEYASSIFCQVIISIFLGLKKLDQQTDSSHMSKFITQLANDANIQAKGVLPLIFGVKFLDWGLTQKHRKVNQRLKYFNSWVKDCIDKQIKQYKKLDQQNTESMSILIAHQKIKQKEDNLQKQGQPKLQNDNEKLYNIEELIAQLKNFIIAGTDTSTSFLRMMIYYVSKSPEVQKSLRKQIKEFINDEDIDMQKLKNMKYLQAIQNETTRMFGPVNFNFPRRVLKDHYIEGIPIYKQTIIQYHSVCTHYNTQLYAKPHQFIPQRWLNIKQQDKNSANLVGFGLGLRNCIGQQLALVQTKIAMIKFYQRYEQVKIKQNIGFKWKFLYKPDNFNVKVAKY